MFFVSMIVLQFSQMLEVLAVSLLKCRTCFQLQPQEAE